MAKNTGSQGTLVGQGFNRQLADLLTTAEPPSRGLRIPPEPERNCRWDLRPRSPSPRLRGRPSGGNVVNPPIGSILPGVLSRHQRHRLRIVGTRLNVDLALEALTSRARPGPWPGRRSRPSRTIGGDLLGEEEVPYATVSSAGTHIQLKEAVLGST